MALTLVRFLNPNFPRALRICDFVNCRCIIVLDHWEIKERYFQNDSSECKSLRIFYIDLLYFYHIFLWDLDHWEIRRKYFQNNSSECKPLRISCIGLGYFYYIILWDLDQWEIRRRYFQNDSLEYRSLRISLVGLEYFCDDFSRFKSVKNEQIFFSINL